jgi:hypothetical protein
MSHHPAQDPPNPAGEEVRRDVGSWISGPCVTAEPVRADSVDPGDVMILADGTAAEVTDTQHSVHRFPDGHQPAVRIGWKVVTGNASGLLIRRGGDTVVVRTDEA